MIDLSGKRLLLLGGQGLMFQLTEEVKKMGIYTIVADYHADLQLSPAKRIADECWNVSWNDIDKLEELCIASRVDGVFAAFSEFRVRAACLLCQRLKLPFYATLDQIDITRDKVCFKDKCRQYGVPVVEEYAFSADFSEEELADVKFPVVIKPADNAGSRGISVCEDADELRDGIEKALSFSASKSFVAERYMECPEVNVSYTVQNGKISLSCVSDAQAGFQKHGRIKLTDGWLFPSKYLREFVQSCDMKLRAMIRGLGIQNGFLFITCFYDAPDFRIFEMGFRLGGGTTYNFISFNNDINYMKMMIAHSLTGEMTGWDVEKSDDPFFKKPCCNLTVVAKPGVVGHIGDLDILRKMDGILTVDPMYSVGQEISDSGTLGQTFARINIVAENPEQLGERINKVYEMLELKDADGKDMILSRLDPEIIAHYWD